MHVVASLKQHMRLPCVCQLAGIQIQCDLVLLESIDVLWKKLNIEENEVTQEDSGTQLNLEEECEEFKRYSCILDMVV